MKKVLFITKSMGCGGVEKTLINLLDSLDYTKFSVDLMLTEIGGEFLCDVPKQVRIIDLNLSKKWKNLINNYGNTIKSQKYLLKKDLKYFVFFVFFKIINKISMTCFHYNLIYNICYRKVNIDSFNYDIVCDYHGYGFFSTIVASKFKDDVIKVSWIHEENINNSYNCIKKFYFKFNKILGVSKECIENFKIKFPNIEESKLEVLHNLVFSDKIKNLANLKPNIDYFKTSQFCIISVGRLSYQKGFDLAIETANLLQYMNSNFIWVIIGDGEQKTTLQNLIDKYKLQNRVILHGYDENPYPYIKNADLYVQTSRYEGFVTTLTEAVILKKPIISTKFSGVSEQVINNLNGYLVDFNASKLANLIEIVMNDRALLKKLSKGNDFLDLSSENSLKKINKIFNLKGGKE